MSVLACKHPLPDVVNDNIRPVLEHSSSAALVSATAATAAVGSAIAVASNRFPNPFSGEDCRPCIPLHHAFHCMHQRIHHLHKLQVLVIAAQTKMRCQQTMEQPPPNHVLRRLPPLPLQQLYRQRPRWQKRRPWCKHTGHEERSLKTRLLEHMRNTCSFRNNIQSHNWYD